MTSVSQEEAANVFVHDQMFNSAIIHYSVAVYLLLVSILATSFVSAMPRERKRLHCIIMR